MSFTTRNVLEGYGEGRGIDVACNVTTGEVNLGTGVTTGDIQIGNLTGSGTTTLDAGGNVYVTSGASAVINATAIALAPIIQAIDNADDVSLFASTTASVTLGGDDTTVNLGTDTGTNSVTVQRVLRTNTVTAKNPTNNVSLYSDLTTGSINIGMSSSRVGSINIGGGANAPIQIDSRGGLTELNTSGGVLLPNGPIFVNDVRPVGPSNPVNLYTNSTGIVTIGNANTAITIPSTLTSFRVNTLNTNAIHTIGNGTLSMNQARSLPQSNIRIYNATRDLDIQCLATDNRIVGNGTTSLRSVGGNVDLIPPGDGDLNLHGGVTTGVVNVGTNSARSGNINIGHVSSTGAIQMFSANSLVFRGSLANFGADGVARTNLRLYGETAGNVLNLENIGGNTRIRGDGTNNTLFIESGRNIDINCQENNNVNIASAQTTGGVFIGNNAARQGVIQLGHEDSSTAIRLRTTDIVDVGVEASQQGRITLRNSGQTHRLELFGGTGADSFVRSVGSALFLQALTNRVYIRGAADNTVIIGDNITSGGVDVGTSSSRSGAIVIGQQSSSGPIYVDAGSSQIFLRGGARTEFGASGSRYGGAIFYSTTFVNFEIQTLATDLRLVGNGVTSLRATERLELQASNTQPIRVHPSQTSGAVEIGFGSGRTGAINIGSPTANASGDITIHGGTGSGKVVIRNPEDGTWTPVLTDFTTAFTTPTALGTYYRYGNMLFCDCEIEWTSTNSATGVVVVDGLPFAAAANTSFAIGHIRGASFNGEYSVAGRINSGTSNIILETAGMTTGNFVSVDQSDPQLDLGGTGNLRFQFFYRV